VVDVGVHRAAAEQIAGDGADDLRSRQADEHGRRRAGHRRGRLARHRAARGVRRDHLGARVVDRELVPGVVQPRGHLRTHRAQPDEADSHIRGHDNLDY
jgi:hypothetical protein